MYIPVVLFIKASACCPGVTIRFEFYGEAELDHGVVDVRFVYYILRQRTLASALKVQNLAFFVISFKSFIKVTVSRDFLAIFWA